MKFLSQTEKTQFFKDLIESASKETLFQSDHPHPFQTEVLGSFLHTNKNSTNAPPVAKKKDKGPSMSYTIGPASRNNKQNDKETTNDHLIPMLSTVDPNRNSHIIPPLENLLNSVLEPTNSLTRESILIGILNDYQAREEAQITPENPISTNLEKICKDVLSINPIFARCLERKIGKLKSKTWQKWIYKIMENLDFKNEQISNCFRINEKWAKKTFRTWRF